MRIVLPKRQTANISNNNLSERARKNTQRTSALLRPLLLHATSEEALLARVICRIRGSIDLIQEDIRAQRADEEV